MQGLEIRDKVLRRGEGEFEEEGAGKIGIESMEGEPELWGTLWAMGT